MFMGDGIGQGIWVVVIVEDYRRWIAVGFITLSTVLLILILYLVIFHCYISFFKYGTTLRYLRGEYKTSTG